MHHSTSPTLLLRWDTARLGRQCGEFAQQSLERVHLGPLLGVQLLPPALGLHQPLDGPQPLPHRPHTSLDGCAAAESRRLHLSLGPLEPPPPRDPQVLDGLLGLLSPPRGTPPPLARPRVGAIAPRPASGGRRHGIRLGG